MTNLPRQTVSRSDLAGARLEFVKIVFGCVLAAVSYGIVHDLITVRICLEYFTIFHPDIFHTSSPTRLALGWGVVATWWAGAMVGLLVAGSAQWGSWPGVTFVKVIPMILRLLGMMAASATIAALYGYRFGTMPSDFGGIVQPAMEHRFLADWWSHSTSYLSGFVGGIVVCGVLILNRKRLAAR